MFLVKLKIVGNVIINDLDEFVINAGTNEVIDLDDYFEGARIKKSMFAPNGSLYNLLKDKVLELIHKDSKEYIRFQKEKDNKNRTFQTSLKSTSQILNELNEMAEDEIIYELNNNYFDNMNVLNKLIDDDRFHPNIKKIAKSLKNDILDSQIDEKFLVI